LFFVPIVLCVENASTNRLSTPFGAIPGPFPVSRSKAVVASAGATGMPVSGTADPGPVTVAGTAFVEEPEAVGGGMDVQPPATLSA